MTDLKDNASNLDLGRRIQIRVAQVKWIQRIIIYECRELKKIFPAKEPTYIA